MREFWGHHMHASGVTWFVKSGCESGCESGCCWCLGCVTALCGRAILVKYDRITIISGACPPGMCCMPLSQILAAQAHCIGPLLTVPMQHHSQEWAATAACTCCPPPPPTPPAVEGWPGQPMSCSSRLRKPCTNWLHPSRLLPLLLLLLLLHPSPCCCSCCCCCKPSLGSRLPRELFECLMKHKCLRMGSLVLSIWCCKT